MVHLPGRIVAGAAVAAALATLVAPVLPAHAAPAASGRVVASGLDNPRQLSIGPAGAVYVAEAGRGGPGPCIPNPEDPNSGNCLGPTGAVTKIARGAQERVVEGLPSVAGTGGSSAQGPGDVAVTGNHIAVVIGFGGAPDARATFGEGGALLGTVVAGRIGGPLAKVADPLAYEAAHNPHPAQLDTNPTGLLARGRSGEYLVVDAGANDLLQVGKREATVAVFADRLATAPWGAPLPMQSVPTDVVEGPDGAFYISELTGFPFPVGGSVVWRVVPGQEPTVYASGLTNVTALDWKGDTLYAVQLSDAGLLNGVVGSLRRVVPGATKHPVVAGGLFAPYGVAIHGGTAYVSTCTIAADPIPGACPDGGEVRAFALR